MSCTKTGGAEAPPMLSEGGRDSASGNQLEELEGRNELLHVVGAGDEAEPPSLRVIEDQDEVLVIDEMNFEKLPSEITSLDEQQTDLSRIGVTGLEEHIDFGLNVGNPLLERLLLLAVNLVDEMPILDLLG